MKLTQFERILKEAGFILVRISKHRVWARGTERVALPNHEVNRMLARRILKEIKYVGRVSELNFG